MYYYISKTTNYPYSLRAPSGITVCADFVQVILT